MAESAKIMRPIRVRRRPLRFRDQSSHVSSIQEVQKPGNHNPQEIIAPMNSTATHPTPVIETSTQTKEPPRTNLIETPDSECHAFEDQKRDLVLPITLATVDDWTPSTTTTLPSIDQIAEDVSMVPAGDQRKNKRVTFVLGKNLTRVINISPRKRMKKRKRLPLLVLDGFLIFEFNTDVFKSRTVLDSLKSIVLDGPESFYLVIKLRGFGPSQFHKCDACDFERFRNHLDVIGRWFYRTKSNIKYRLRWKCKPLIDFLDRKLLSWLVRRYIFDTKLTKKALLQNDQDTIKE